MQQNRYVSLFLWGSTKVIDYRNYRESPVIESVVLAAFEEVSVAICVLQRCVQVVRKSFPVGEWLGVSALDRWLLWRIESPELGAWSHIIGYSHIYQTSDIIQQSSIQISWGACGYTSKSSWYKMKTTDSAPKNLRIYQNIQRPVLKLRYCLGAFLEGLSPS